MTRARATRGRRLPRQLLGRIVTPGRAGGLLGMLAAGYLWTLVTGPAAFGVERVDAPNLRWTADTVVAEALIGVAGTNLFRLDTGPLEARLAALPAIRSAEVSVSLADATVLVTLVEREPILAWRAGDTAYLVDGEGVVVAVRAADAPGISLPTVEDRRRDAETDLAIGERLDPIDLDVATRLASLVPADVGTAAATLRVQLTDRDGYVVAAGGWEAVFGFYGPATRSPNLIPGQVRLLRSLLADREAEVERVILASDTDGTYVPRTTPKPSHR